jgi:hypothetical protein
VFPTDMLIPLHSSFGHTLQSANYLFPTVVSGLIGMRPRPEANQLFQRTAFARR